MFRDTDIPWIPDDVNDPDPFLIEVQDLFDVADVRRGFLAPSMSS
jgi:hypothetical protein